MNRNRMDEKGDLGACFIMIKLWENIFIINHSLFHQFRS
jgi:hypothetical protein